VTPTLELDGARPLAIISVHSCPFAEIGGGENGGMSVYLREVARALAARGLRSHIFTRRDDPGAPPHLDLPDGCHVVHIDAGPPKPLAKDDVFYHLPEFLHGVTEYAREEGVEFQLVHSHYWLSGWVGRRLGGLWGVPWLHTSHTLARVKDRDRPPGASPAARHRVAVEDEIVRDCNRLVSPTAQEVEDLAQLYGVERGCAAIVAPGVDPGTFAWRDPAPVRQALGIAEDAPVLLAVGRLERLKGMDTAIHALADLRGRGVAAELVVVGDDSGSGRAEAGGHRTEKARLLAVARDLEVDDVTHFAGSVAHDRLPEYYSLADVCVVPSYSESFGLVAIEAQACGTPVVASRVGGLRQLVIDGITGYTVARHDPHLYANAIAAILEDPERRASMSAAARQLARNYSWARTADRLVDVYAETIDSYDRAAEAVFA